MGFPFCHAADGRAPRASYRFCATTTTCLQPLTLPSLLLPPYSTPHPDTPHPFLDDPDRAPLGWGLNRGHYDIRITGQDVQRGTFNQRHAVLWDQHNGAAGGGRGEGHWPVPPPHLGPGCSWGLGRRTCVMRLKSRAGLMGCELEGWFSECPCMFGRGEEGNRHIRGSWRRQG